MADKKTLENQIAHLDQKMRNEQTAFVTEKRKVEQEAKASIRLLSSQVSNCMKEMSRKPHEFFFPGELELIRTRGSQIQCAAKCGMHQAAAAMLLAAETEIQLLKLRTENAFREWMEMFTDYKEQVERIHAELTRYSGEPMETPAGSFKLTEDELNFWSKMLYEKMAKKVSRMKLAVEKMEKLDMEQYLTKNKAPKGYEFRKLLRRLEDMEQSAEAMMEGIGAERYYSDERLVSAKQTRDMMGAYGYECLKDGFVWSEGKENPMDSYEMVFCLNPHDQVCTRIVPVRKHGIAVGNQCLLWMDMQTVPEQSLVQGLLDVNHERLKDILVFPIKIEGVDFDEHSLWEEQIKQQADLKQYDEFRRRNRRRGELLV